MAEKQATLLVVEDDPDVADMLGAYFTKQGYQIIRAFKGENGVDLCLERNPDLVILDIRLPDIDGFEVARRLRTHQRTQFIPIIFLTEKRQREDRLHGLELGADDYITKPFDMNELRLRVRNTLWRARLGAMTNPITLMPEGDLVQSRIEDCLSAENWAVLLISLENMEHFREAYGFVAADDALRAIGLIIQNTIREAADENGFVGHISPTEFILICSPGVLATLQKRLQAQLEKSLDFFYPLSARETGTLDSRLLEVKIESLTSTESTPRETGRLRSTLADRQGKAHRPRSIG